MVDREKAPVAPSGRPLGNSPLVVACVAPADPRPEVNSLTGEVWVDPRRADLSPSDAAALEYALRAADAWGGSVVAVGAGPAHIDAGLRQAVAVGAAALRVPWGAAGLVAAGPEPIEGAQLAADPQALAWALAAAISGLGEPALVVCGDRSTLGGTGAVPALLAHHLGVCQALGLVGLQFEADAVIAQRRLDGGWREQLRVAPPAVCSVEAAGVRLRRAGLAGSLAASDAAVPVAVVASDPGRPAARLPGAPAGAGPPHPYRPRAHVVAAPSGTTQERLLALTGALAADDPPRIVGPVDSAGAAAELLAYLGRHGYLDHLDHTGD